MSPTFDSYSQNGEDVVLHRALSHIDHGRYIDVGANDPLEDSVSMAFYERGWHGITVEPDPAYANRQRHKRPRDLLVEAAATDKDRDRVVLHVVEGTGLSTLLGGVASNHASAGLATHDVEVETRRIDSILDEAGWHGTDIHFMSVDTEGSEHEVLAGIDLGIWRPWILVVEATAPNSTESTRSQWESLVLDAGYQFCLFDGLSCFYVADEHFEELAPRLGHPACPLDNYTTWTLREVMERNAAMLPLVDDVVRWRAQALMRWATAVNNEIVVDNLRSELTSLRHQHNALNHHYHLSQEDAVGLHQQIADLHASTSWRVTRPLRAMSGLVARLRGRR